MFVCLFLLWLSFKHHFQFYVLLPCFAYFYLYVVDLGYLVWVFGTMYIVCSRCEFLYMWVEINKTTANAKKKTTDDKVQEHSRPNHTHHSITITNEQKMSNDNKQSFNNNQNVNSSDTVYQSESTICYHIRIRSNSMHVWKIKVFCNRYIATAMFHIHYLVLCSPTFSRPGCGSVDW